MKPLWKRARSGRRRLIQHRRSLTRRFREQARSHLLLARAACHLLSHFAGVAVGHPGDEIDHA
ncbi:hypothetical protein DZG01_04130 [Pseudomonas fluorescens]|nr:hypothetical protein DZG01_04130 [Pseudomonas fluorescens]